MKIGRTLLEYIEQYNQLTYNLAMDSEEAIVLLKKKD